ncbi:MAG: transposase [Deltaproteobacteria bacterium]|nr:transposase [Deltaproteobacteria bacterium]
MPKSFFLQPLDPMQKRYEALRASFVEDLSAEEVARRFGYSIHTIHALRRDFKAGLLPPFFRALTRGPKQRRPSSLTAKGRIVELRKQNYSIEEIEETLLREGYDITAKTIYQILKDEGFARLFRRTHAERRIALQQAKDPAEIATIKEFAAHGIVNTAYGGVFLFIPTIIELQLDTLFNQVGFYGSRQIPRLNYLMSFLALKLIGKERLSHVNDLNFDYGLGTFAGLNVLPKAAAITQYSYRNPRNRVVTLLKKWNRVLKEKGYIQGRHINLDFHSVPHWGEESQLQNHWVPTRGKAMKSVLCFFAQDLDTTYLCYSNGQLSKEEAPDEILNFLSFYQTSHGRLPETLVFDSRLTPYRNLNVLDKDFGVKFITLQRRGKRLLQQINKISDWKKIRLTKRSRKYQLLKIFEQPVSLKDYDGQLRQIVVTGTGRLLPMLIITNDFDSSAKEIIETYALRWLIENNIQENVDFFSLNALSSSIIVKVDFDIGITLIANTLYKMMAQKFQLFETAKPKTIYRNIVEGAAKIHIDSRSIKVVFGKKAFNPLIMDWISGLPELKVPWMGNRILQYDFE